MSVWRTDYDTAEAIEIAGRVDDLAVKLRTMTILHPVKMAPFWNGEIQSALPVELQDADGTRLHVRLSIHREGA